MRGHVDGWGIAGPGRVAGAVAADRARVPGSELAVRDEAGGQIGAACSDGVGLPA